MTEYEVAFEVIIEQTIIVEAPSAKEAIAKVKRGEYDINNCETITSTKPRRNWSAQPID